MYYRPKGQKGIPLPDLDPQSMEFKEAYVRAARGEITRPHQIVSGTIAAGVKAYLASDTHAAKATSTRTLERRFGQEIAADYGNGTMASLRSKHIRTALSKYDAHPANNRLRTWRALGKFWTERGFIEDDPARHVRARKAPPAKGATPWTREDFAKFRAHWHIGTPQRLAFELMYQTCAAVVDIVKLGPACVKGGWIVYARQKTDTEAVSPITNAPDWFEASTHFAEAIAAAPKHMTYLTTSSGASKSAKSVASWFSKSCTAAGLPDRSAHGIRKGRAAIFKENGAAADKRMAILGHETEEEARGYSKSADLIKTVSGTESSNPPYHVGTNDQKANKNNGL